MSGNYTPRMAFSTRCNIEDAQEVVNILIARWGKDCVANKLSDLFPRWNPDAWRQWILRVTKARSKTVDMERVNIIRVALGMEELPVRFKQKLWLVTSIDHYEDRPYTTRHRYYLTRGHAAHEVKRTMEKGTFVEVLYGEVVWAEKDPHKFLKEYKPRKTAPPLSNPKNRYNPAREKVHA